MTTRSVHRGISEPQDDLRATLNSIKERRALKRNAWEFKGDLLQILEKVMPYVTVVCLAPLIYAFMSLLLGPKTKQEELLTTLLDEVRQLRLEVRQLSDDRCPA